MLKTQQRAPDQSAIVDGSQLVKQCIRILFQGAGRANTNPERLGVADKPRRERRHARRQMVSVSNRGSLRSGSQMLLTFKKISEGVRSSTARSSQVSASL